MIKTCGFGLFVFSEDVNVGGLSNTPPLSPKTLNNNVCIDYLRIRFNREFSLDDNKFKIILKKFGFDIRAFTPVRGLFGYTDGFNYGENFYVYSGGDYNALADGSKTCVFELSGQACREVETLNQDFNWYDVLSFILIFEDYQAKRIDLALDDFQGYMDTRKIGRLLLDKKYVSRFISCPRVTFSDGFSATFGSQGSNLQLCIYDKVAERKYRGYELNFELKSWVRYETRFMNDYANDIFTQLCKALKDDKLDKFVKGCLSWTITFSKNRIVNNSFNSHGLRDVKVDKDFEALISDRDVVVPTLQAHLESTIVRKTDWVDRSTIASNLEIEASVPDDYDSAINFMKKRKIDKLNNKSLARVNNYRRSIGKDPYETVDDMKRVLDNRYKGFDLPSDETLKLMGFIDENGVVKKGFK